MATSTKSKELTLNQKQELFCQLYATESEFFGNGVQSYIEAYQPKRTPNWYKTACADASRLLSKAKVCNRINEILEESGFNDVAVDKQLAFLLTQHIDLKTKLGAIKEFNKLKQRITEKSEVELKVPTVMLEGVYGSKPNFRASNTPSETPEVAEDSSSESS